MSSGDLEEGFTSLIVQSSTLLPLCWSLMGVILCVVVPLCCECNE